MRATDFEFRYRFYIVTLIFWLGFSCSWIDHQRAGKSLELFLGLHGKLSLHVIYGFGSLVVATGAAIRTWAAAYLDSDVVHDMDLHSDRLVADGPYRYVRNPLYLGVLLLSAGMGLMASRLGWIFLVAGNFWFYMRLAYREEAALAVSQGASYLAYQRAVPRILPSFTARLPPSGRSPRWSQALFGESFMWAFAVATLLFAVTLDGQVTWTITALILFAYLASQIVLRLRKRRAATQK